MLIEHTDVDRTALRNRIVVITGSGQGIGKETARILAALGASVVIAEIHETGCETAHAIQSAGGKALFVQTDVAEPASMEHLHQQICATFGGVDILINNAAAYTTKPILEHSVAEWDRVFAVNLRGAFLGIKTFLPEMLRRGTGVIVTMESAEGMPYLAPYLASKVGLRSLALSLAQEVGAQSGVSVYCFGAGMVDTPGGMGAFQQLAPRYGMSPDAFIQQSAPGGQLISAEVCATGLVGTILHAHAFHGQETDYVAGLARLGLSATGTCTDAKPHQMVNMSRLPPELIHDALVLNCQIEALLQANSREFDEQSIFAFPIVRRMFRQGTGLTVETWLKQAREMTQNLENVSINGNEGYTFLDAPQLAAYITDLQRMMNFIAKQEADARGWISDAEQLQGAMAALRQRKAMVEQLVGVLEQIQQLK